MKIYLHIGTHKTGTTAIQSLIFRNSDFLAEHGIFVPQVDREAYRRGLADVAVLLRQDQFEEVRDFIHACVREAEASGARVLLISSEEFSTAAPQHIEALAQILKPFDVEVILYLRNVYEYALSLCGEQIKRPGSVQRYEALAYEVTSRLNYTELLSRWEASFGAEKLDVRCYNDVRTSLLETFYGHLGVPADALDALIERRSFQKNKSIDMATQLMLSVANINSDMGKLVRSNEVYDAAFSDFPYVPPMLVNIARMFCRAEFMDFSHPRLAPFVDTLTRPIPEEEETEEEKTAYLERLGLFALKLAAERRGQRTRRQKLRDFIRVGKAASQDTPVRGRKKKPKKQR